MKSTNNNHKGSSLIFAMIASVIIIGFAGTAMLISTYEHKLTTFNSYKLVCRYIAEAGQARATQALKLFTMNTSVTYSELDKFINELNTQMQLTDVPLTSQHDGKTQVLGHYTVKARLLTPSDITVTEDITGDKTNSVRYVQVDSVGTVKTSPNSSIQVTVSTTYKIQSEVARVFDYCYFVNNWGWFYGNNIITYGNCRVNGSFSMGNYRPTIWGKPRFNDNDGFDLLNQIDDNLDGQLNTQDGGIYAWNVIDGQPAAAGRPADLYAGLQGESTMYDMPQLPMPNLNDLSIYEQKAKETSAYIKIGDQVVCDGILGDNELKQNLYLEGTYEQPIQIQGTVVVRGDLIIRGYVTGQGAIYSGRNIYVPQRILYRNSPGERRPSNNSESARENWLVSSAGLDLLGLFARENIVISDYTDPTWRNYVYNWIQHPSNVSSEDSGIDKIPNTYDAGEGDGVWSVLKTLEGTIIPGTGEDIDGDGKYDGTTQLSDFNLSTTSIYTNHPGWAGNIPAGVTNFSQLASWNETLDAPGIGANITDSKLFPQVDAALYTNHFLGGYFGNKNGYGYKSDNRTHYLNDGCTYFNGAVISRNESLIYDSRDIIYQHDERLTASSSLFNLALPRVWKPLQIIGTDIQ